MLGPATKGLGAASRGFACHLVALTLLFLAMFALCLGGCSGRETGDDARATLEGKVEPRELDHGAGIAGLAIRVFQIGPGGKLREVGARAARTDEQGGYQAEIFAAREPGPWPLLVDFYQGETLASRVLVAAAVHANERLAVAPAGRETFLEAQILLRALRTGQWPHNGSVAWMRAMVTAELAATLPAGLASGDPRLDALAHAFSSALMAWEMTVESRVVEASGEQWGEATRLLGEALVRHDAQMYRAQNAEARGLARARYHDALLSSLREAGIRPHEMAIGAHHATWSFEVLASALEAKTRARVLADVHGFRARVLTLAVPENLERLGASRPVRDGLELAGAELRAALAASVGRENGQAQRARRVAWERYSLATEVAAERTLREPLVYGYSRTGELAAMARGQLDRLSTRRTALLDAASVARNITSTGLVFYERVTGASMLEALERDAAGHGRSDEQLRELLWLRYHEAAMRR